MMKFKMKLSSFAAAVILLLSGCAGPAGSGPSAGASPSAAPTASLSVSAPAETGTAIPAAEKPAEPSVTSSPEPEETGVSKNYSKAYYDVIADLIHQYGFLEYHDEGPAGLYRGDLIDFENDGVPELVCVFRKDYFHTVSIFRYENGKAEELVSELAGESADGYLLSEIRFAEIDGKHYILTQNNDSAKSEKIKALTVENGALKTEVLCADTEGGKEAGVSQYLNCRIDDKSVSEEEYSSRKENYYRNATFWYEIIDEDGNRCDPEDYDVQLIKSLAAGAGISEGEVNKLVTGADYEFITETYEDGGISIRYPKFTGMPDAETQSAINGMIKESALKDIDSIKSEDDNENYKLDYKVMYCKLGYLSIKFPGCSYYGEGAYAASFVFTVNIDMKNRSLIRLSDLIKIDESFVEEVRNYISDTAEYDGGPEYKEALNEFLNQTDTAGWITELTNADTSDSDCCSYFTQDHLVISVPIHHALGDYIEVWFVYYNIDQYNIGHPLWDVVG